VGQPETKGRGRRGGRSRLREGKGRCGGGRERGWTFFLPASFALQLLETLYFASPRLLLCVMQNGLCLSHFALHC
jgi:hypothetical protein